MTAQPKPTAADVRPVTTEYVRTVYSRCPVDSLNGGRPNPAPDYAARQFDRWLAEHDAQVEERLLRRLIADAAGDDVVPMRLLRARADRVAGGAT